VCFVIIKLYSLSKNIMPHIHEKIDFVVETFVVYQNKVLLRMHDKFKMWLSIGGHIELDEDPNQAAVREVKEEVGLDIKLYDGNKSTCPDTKEDKQLIPPIALSRHFVNPTHEHVCSTYFATATSDKVIPEKPTDEWKWVTKEELDTMDLLPFVSYYAKEALKRLS
jgi:8-oxo-dGTP pyrophosphatase MutT (NUDIX family)